MYTLPSQPLSIGKVLDNSFSLYKTSLLALIPLMIVISGLNFVSQIFSPGMTMAVEENPDLAMSAVTDYYIIATVIGLINLLLVLAAIARLNSISRSTSMSIPGALKVASKHWLKVFLAFIFYLIATILGTILLIVPGVIVMLSMSFFMFLILIDGLGPFSSLGASHRLVWGNWWRSATVLSVPVIIIVILATLALIPGMLYSIDSADFESMMFIVLVSYTVLNVITYPLYLAVGLVLFNDLKLRTQGEDIAARLSGD